MDTSAPSLSEFLLARIDEDEDQHHRQEWKP